MKRATPILLLLLAASPALPAEDPVVARFQGQVITASQLDRILGLYTTEAQRQMNRNPQFKREILKKHVENVLLAEKAREKGVDQLADVRERVRILSNEALAQAYLEKEVIGKAEPSEDELKGFYQRHLGEFTQPEAVSLRQILVRSPATAPAEERRKAREQAERALQRIEAGEEFATLAAEFTDDPAFKQRGGALGVVTRGKLSPAVEEAAFALKPGEVSRVVETSYGYSILKVDERTRPGPRPFEQVRARVREMALAEAKQKRIAEARSRVLNEAGVEFYPERPDEEAGDRPHRHPPR